MLRKFSDCKGISESSIASFIGNDFLLSWLSYKQFCICMMRNANLLLYLNLAGEVFYIIVHRMKSQKVKEEHQERVRNDIAVAICHTTVIQNLLKGSLQILNLKLADVRILMDRIVHSSIMTVNAFSMEKLFELTLIATKYQYTTCQFPSDILLIALNHLDTIRKAVTDNQAKMLTENLHNLLVDRFKDVDVRTMQTYRYLVLSYLADVKLKMTNLIRLGLQKTSGEFVKPFPDKVKRSELHQSGLIEVYKCPDEDEVSEFKCYSCDLQCDCNELDSEETLRRLTSGKCPVKVHESTSKGKEVLTTRFKVEEPELNLSTNMTAPLRTSFALNGDRGIMLGLSIYDIPGNCDDAPIRNDDSESEETKENVEPPQRDYSAANIVDFTDDYIGSSDLYATKGLDLCSVLLGCEPSDSGDANNQSLSSGVAGTSHAYSASALGLESVLDNFPSLGFGSRANALKENAIDEQLNMNPNSINVIRFDARSDSTGSKAALVAIAQDFFDLEAEDKGGNGKYKSAMDALLNDFDMPNEDG